MVTTLQFEAINDTFHSSTKVIVLSVDQILLQHIDESCDIDNISFYYCSAVLLLSAGFEEM